MARFVRRPLYRAHYEGAVVYFSDTRVRCRGVCESEKGVTQRIWSHRGVPPRGPDLQFKGHIPASPTAVSSAMAIDVPGTLCDRLGESFFFRVRHTPAAWPRTRLCAWL